MGDLLDEKDVRTCLWLHDQPLTGVNDTGTEWQLGLLSFSKTYPGFRSGWGRPLTRGAHLQKQWFEIDGRRGWAVVFHAGGDPANYFAGWVPPERESEADRWIALLNGEIAARLSAPT